MANRIERSRASRTGATDRRVIRTRELIVEAFIELCGEQGAQAVSVAGIARRAGVNRATFYRHFEGKTDIGERGIEMLLGAVFEEIEDGVPAESVIEDRILSRMTRFFEAARDRGRLFRLLISGAAGSALLEKAEAYVEGFLRERRLATAGEEALRLPLPLASRVLTSTLFGFASWWLDHPRQYTARRMAELCLDVAARGFFRSSEERTRR